MLACLSRLLWHFKVGEQRSGISAFSSLSLSLSLSFFCELTGQTPARIDSKNGKGKVLLIVGMFNVDVLGNGGGSGLFEISNGYIEWIELIKEDIQEKWNFGIVLIASQVFV